MAAETSYVTGTCMHLIKENINAQFSIMNSVSWFSLLRNDLDIKISDFSVGMALTRHCSFFLEWLHNFIIKKLSNCKQSWKLS